MPIPMSLQGLLNSRLRTARKAARLRVKEATRLSRRGKREIAGRVLDEVEERAEQVRIAARSSDAALIERSTQRLASLVDKHLATYRKPAWRESFEGILVAVCVALLLRAFVIEAFKIPSGSMIPTLEIGDQIFVNKYVYGIRIPFTSTRLIDFSLPERGDVIVFIFPGPSREDYIKRVVGLPGDEILVRDGVLSINGQPVERQYHGVNNFIDRDQQSKRWYGFRAQTFQETVGDHVFTALQENGVRPSVNDYGPYVVPNDSVFVMGDNRDHSSDSRAWGPVPASNILGRAMFVWFSWGRDGFNVSRLGTWVD